MSELKLNDRITVDISDYRYIALLKKHGPQMQILLPVTMIIELLNAEINVKIPAKWEASVYALLVTYNQLARTEDLPTADIAEKILRTKIEGDVRKEQQNTPNPFRDDGVGSRPRTIVTPQTIAQTLLDQGVRKNDRIRVTVKRPKLHELIMDKNQRDIAQLPHGSSEYDDMNLSPDP